MKSKSILFFIIVCIMPQLHCSSGPARATAHTNFCSADQRAVQLQTEKASQEISPPAEPLHKYFKLSPIYSGNYYYKSPASLEQAEAWEQELKPLQAVYTSGSDKLCLDAIRYRIRCFKLAFLHVHLLTELQQENDELKKQLVALKEAQEPMPQAPGGPQQNVQPPAAK